MAAERRVRVSLETKVMVPVLAVLVGLPVIMLWILNARLQRQMQSDAELTLSTVQTAFVQALRIRGDELGARFRRGDSRFDQIVRLNDSATMSAYLREVLDEFRDDTEFALFYQPTGEVMASARRGGTAGIDAEAFATLAEPYLRAVLQNGEAATGTLSANGSAYYVAASPTALAERALAGVLVFGIRLTDDALKEIRPPASEILVLAGDHVAASTLTDSLRKDLAWKQVTDKTTRGLDDMVTVNGERFLPAAGELVTLVPQAGVRYVLLSSSERRLTALEQTRFALLGVSVLGIVASAGMVWFFVRRITRPLVELRDSAEAVGRGDFSRRIERFSNDECGELAQEFNHMTSGLQSSRAELERAMQQVKVTQEQLIQSEKLSAVGQFVAGVAHELNNPLTAVVGFSELVQSMPADPQIREYLDRVAKSAHRCHKIVQSLLSFARQHPPERKRVDLNAAIDDVLEIMAYDLRTSDITIVREYASNLPAIVGDAHQLQQVFINILGNARQAIEPVRRGGRIIVRTLEVAGKVVVEFEDNGPGIQPEHLARIFDPFFTTKPVGKGTGLGLSLCYGIIQEHGGKISARSEVGQGAIFAIELPVAANAEAVPALRAATASPFPSAAVQPSGKTVLVIDDEQWILDLARELLRAEGHVVETAIGGEPAMELLRQRRFDVVVADWKMPGLNGIRLYEHLCATDPAMAKRVLFMTGDVVNDTFQEFLRTNELSCLSKPFAAREFRAAVKKMFAASVG